MELVFINHQDLWHFERLHQRLKEVLQWEMGFLNKSKASKVIITSVYRPLAEEIRQGRSGIHGLHRAIDQVIIKQDGTAFSQNDYDSLAIIINKAFFYGDRKHNVAVSFPHGTGLHIHLQARDETTYRNRINA